MRVKVFCAIISLLAALSQRNLPYHADSGKVHSLILCRNLSFSKVFKCRSSENSYIKYSEMGRYVLNKCGWGEGRDEGNGASAYTILCSGAFYIVLVFHVRSCHLLPANIQFLFFWTKKCHQLLGNDVLFFGDSSYLHELASFCEFVLQNLVDAIQQEPSKVTITFNVGFPFPLPFWWCWYTDVID